jgi:hypothetical protein
MRKLMTATMALSAVGIATLAAPTPAAAYDYPWCAQGRGVGIPGECSYRTFAQCQASASGRNLTCNINPRVAFAIARRGPPPYGYPYAYPYPSPYPYPDRYRY